MPDLEPAQLDRPPDRVATRVATCSRHGSGPTLPFVAVGPEANRALLLQGGTRRPSDQPGLIGQVRSALRSFTAPPDHQPPPLVPVPEVDAEHLATLVAAATGVWALLLADGRSYKAEGDVSDLLWWAIKTVRFEAGELDDYDPSIHRLNRDAAII